MFTPRISSPSSSELRPTKTIATSESFASASASESAASAGGDPAELDRPARARLPVLDAQGVLPAAPPAATRTRTGRRGPGAAWVEVTWVEGPPPTVELLVVEEQARRGRPVPHAGAHGQLVLAASPAASAWPSSAASTSRDRRRRPRRGPPSPCRSTARGSLRRSFGSPWRSGLSKYSTSTPARRRRAARGRSTERARGWRPCTSRRARTAPARPGTAARSPPAASPAGTRCRCSSRAARRGRPPRGRGPRSGAPTRPAAGRRPRSSAGRSPARSASRASCRCALESFSEIAIFENGTRSGGSNMPRRTRATKSRCSERSISASVMRPAFTSSTRRPVLGAAGEVRARLDGGDGRLAQRGRELVVPVDVAHRAAVAHDVALEAPLVPQPLLEQVGAGAARAFRSRRCRRT